MRSGGNSPIFPPMPDDLTPPESAPPESAPRSGAAMIKDQISRPPDTSGVPRLPLRADARPVTLDMVNRLRDDLPE